jgi:hypothetical protein
LKTAADDVEPGKKLWYNTSLQPQALFNLRGVLEAIGYEIPDSVMDLDLDELEGTRLGVSVEHRDYKGKAKADIVAVFPLEEQPASEPAPKPVAGPKKVVKKAPEPEPEGSNIEVGTVVSFDSEGKSVSGKVASIDEEAATAVIKVKVGKVMENWEVELAELTPVES